jgi:hypothetical protein
MQFSFVVTMPQKFNTSSLRTQEVSRIKDYIGKTVLPTIAEQAKKKFVGGILQDTVLNSSASPTLIEYYTSWLTNTLQGKPAVKVVKKSKSKATNAQAVPISVIVKDPKKLKTKNKSGGIKIARSSVPLATQMGSDLTGLQNLINQHLQNAISANMGDGTRRDILNYRTGRLASSAKVEYVSQSRAGMITAFYSYMKNPYATFSGGGQQQYPRSRDPKLLISKSIREIAATQVGNRLRAVNV